MSDKNQEAEKQRFEKTRCVRRHNKASARKQKQVNKCELENKVIENENLLQV